MQKVVFLVLITIGVAFLYADTTNSEPLKKDDVDPNMCNVMEKTALACRLYITGLEQKSPILLIAASDLLSEFSTTPPPDATDKPKEEGKTQEASDKPIVNSKFFLEKAREFAGGNEEVLSIIESRMGALGQAQRGLIDSEKKKMAAVGGVWVWRAGIIPPKESITLTGVFEGKMPAVVRVITTVDVAMWVYDESGKLITKDMNSGYEVSAAWKPKWEGTFKVVIQNRDDKHCTRFIVLVN